MTTAGPLAAERRGRLVLRPWRWVALGLLVGPLVALSLYWAMIACSAIMTAPDQIDYDHLFGMWLLIVLFGGALCLLVEIVVIVPLLAGHYRFGWRLLNGWTAVLIGFMCGALPFLLLTIITDAMAPGSSYSAGGTDLIVNGQRTLAGWLQMLLPGAVGAISAGVFRLIAVRRV